MSNLEKKLIDFGNYLLSKDRKKSIINKVNIDKVTHADVCNFKDKRKN